MNYIAIEREYGSGGTEIARKVAERLGVPCYGREILEAVSERQNISVGQIDRYEENVSNSFLYSAFMISKAQSGDPDMLSKEGHIFVAEQTAIQNFALLGPAVFVGHCAAEALREKHGLIRVFIKSNEQNKLQRIKDEYGIETNVAKNTMERFDRKRANYYYANTTKKWTARENYDIILDSGKLGIEGCVEILETAMKHDFHSTK